MWWLQQTHNVVGESCQKRLSHGRSLIVWTGWCLFGLGISLVFAACSQGDCRFDSDCPDDKICKKGTCSSNLLARSCRSDSECAVQEVCLAASCVKVECEEGQSRTCYEGPAGTMNVGICRGGQQSCRGRRWSACEGQILPVQEVCNQLDDDCNGKVDDDSSCQASCQEGQTRPCYTGPTGTQDVGICRRGSETCSGGKWSGACVGETLPAAKEICDDKQDNNCNGQVDEGCGPCQQGDTRSCYTGPPNTRNIGICRDGVQSCQNGQWGLCQGEVKPTTETCDNQDNDCNGQIDDAANCQKACQNGQTRPCYNGPANTQGVGICKAGVEVCANNQWSGTCQGAVVPSAEQCDDKLDNNCNGQVDENCGVCRTGDQEVCFSANSGCSKQPDGSYRCETPCRAGVRTCQGGQWSSCQGEVTPQAKDLCGNNIDDDCNGKIDDNCGVCTNGQTQSCYTGPPGTSGIGICKPGTQTCQNGQWGTCTGVVVPGSEICNDGIDNNCNGQVDENCQSNSKLHQACNGNTDCDSGQVCIAFQGQSQGVCFQDCSASSGICASNTDGRNACTAYAITPQSQTISVCAKEVSTGSSCDVTKSVVCRQGNACIGGTCQTVVTSTEGQACDPQATTPVLCDSNLTCVGFGAGFPNICLRTCDKSNPSSCGSGYTCVSLSSGTGACLQTGCTSSTQCLYTDHACVNDSNLGTTACYPLASPGPVGFGGVCAYGNVATQCQKGLTCLGLQTASNGFCSHDCTNTGTCPGSPSGAQCVTINSSGQKACLFPCTSCPSSLKCNTTYNYCFPP